MHKKTNVPLLYLIRHASPDWERSDIRYDIPPGPALTARGEQEARDLGHFLSHAGVRKLYYSPLERSTRTALIAAALARVPALEKGELAEWRRDETEPEIHARFWPLVQASLEESARIGPLGLVTHGGPVAYLLKQFGMDPERLASQRRQFDHANPLPPAGVWAARQDPGTGAWDLQLVFTPGEPK